MNARLCLAFGLLASASTWPITAAEAPDDYLDPGLRARVEALKANLASLPSNRANAHARASTLSDWVNAYARSGRYVPVNATAVASGVMAYPMRSGRIANLDPAIAEMAVLDEHGDSLGTLAADSGPFRVRSHATIKQTYTVGSLDVEPGGGFIVARQFMTGTGAFQTDDETAANYITIESSNPNVRFARAGIPLAGMHGGFRGAVEALAFRLTSGHLTEGDSVTITYGDTSAGGPGLLLPSFSTDRMALPLYVDFDGSDLAVSLPIQPIIVVGDDVHGVDGFAPSVVATGEPFTLTVRARDRDYNRATGVVPAWQVFANGKPLTSLPPGNALQAVNGLSFQDPGTYRITIASSDGKVTGEANPILVEDAPRRRIYWGDTHGHSGFAEGVGTSERYMTWARDDAQLDFVTHSEHDIWLDDFEWAVLQENVRKYTALGKFVAFLGYEWTVQNTQGGHHNVLFRTPDDRLRIPAQDYSTLSRLYDGLREHHALRDVVVIPHAHQAGDYRQSDPGLEPLVEIMSQHGSFEWFGRKYLDHGHQIGFIAASDNHLTQPGFNAPQGGSLSQRGGLAAVRTDAVTPNALFDAMRNRATYATTGDRMILDVTVNGAEMGQRAAFEAERVIGGRVIGTAPIKEVVVVRNGTEIWQRDYSPEASSRGPADGDYVLTFESPSLPYHPGDNPRGWRWWWGELVIQGATATAAQGLGLAGNGAGGVAVDGVDLTDGSSVAFRTRTRGGPSSIRLTLTDVRRMTTLRLKLREGREFGGGPPRYRSHATVPEAEVELPLRELAGGNLSRTVEFDGFVDTVSLRQVGGDGPLDVTFETTDTGRREGDYYYVRVTQTNDAMAWSSPVWVGGHPPR